MVLIVQSDFSIALIFRKCAFPGTMSAERSSAVAVVVIYVIEQAEMEVTTVNRVVRCGGPGSGGEGTTADAIGDSRWHIEAHKKR